MTGAVAQRKIDLWLSLVYSLVMGGVTTSVNLSVFCSIIENEVDTE
jgi:hypothetical protein